MTTWLADDFHCLLSLHAWMEQAVILGKPTGLELRAASSQHVVDWRGPPAENSRGAAVNKQITHKEMNGANKPLNLEWLSLEWDHNPGPNENVPCNLMSDPEAVAQVSYVWNPGPQKLWWNHCMLFFAAKFSEMCFEIIDHEYISEHSFLLQFWQISYVLEFLLIIYTGTT